jgi:hypothetical protein
MKTAVIISGMLRNYEAALLSLHIWGDDTEVDRYLLTWKSAGETAINDYCTKAKIRDKLIVDDAITDSFPIHLHEHNWPKMTFLWQTAFKWVPKQGYDKYILIRPDCFYWTYDIPKLREAVRSAEKISPLGNNFSEGIIGDQLTIVNPSFANYMTRAHDEICNNPMSLNKDCNFHLILGKFYSDNVSEKFTLMSYSAGLDLVIVRDTYKLWDSDIYNFDLYKDLFYDMSAWWKRKFGTKTGFLRLPPSNLE